MISILCLLVPPWEYPEGWEAFWLSLSIYYQSLPCSVIYFSTPLLSAVTLLTLVSGTPLAHLTLPSLWPGCPSWPLPLSIVSRGLVSALHHVHACHLPWFKTTDAPDTMPSPPTPKAWSPLTSKNPRVCSTSGPELYLLHHAACLCCQTVRKAPPFLAQHFQKHSQGRAAQAPRHVVLSTLTHNLLPAGVSPTQIWGR